MLKRICKKKIILSIIILLLVITLNIIPINNNKEKNIQEKISYVNFELETNDVYLLDKNNYLNRVPIATKKQDEELIYELLNILICNSKDKDKIPNGFKCTIPENTKIININLNNETLKLNLSNEFLNMKKNLEEKVIESIVYTITNIDKIKNIIIYIDGDLLTELPNTKIKLPSTLNRDIGINKKYELTSNKNIKKTTIFYINNIEDKTYYTPVTLINNDPREKIEIIIDELSNKLMEDNLYSYLNNNTIVLNSSIKDNIMSVNFNENILNGLDNNNILEEVIYTISLSIGENYSVEKVFFNVNDKEIVKTTLKSLE